MIYNNLFLFHFFFNEIWGIQHLREKKKTLICLKPFYVRKKKARC